MKKVEFTIPTHRLFPRNGVDSVDAADYRTLIDRVLGIPEAQVDRSKEFMLVRCPAEVFAEFLIERRNVGLQNMFHELNPRFVHVTPPKKEQRRKFSAFDVYPSPRKAHPLPDVDADEVPFW